MVWPALAYAARDLPLLVEKSSSPIELSHQLQIFVDKEIQSSWDNVLEGKFDEQFFSVQSDVYTRDQ